MRKWSKRPTILFGISALTLTVGFGHAGVAYASDSNIKILVDHTPLSADVQPVIVNSRTLLPLRAVFEALGATVEWLPERDVIHGTKGATVIDLHLDDTQATVNGQAVKLDVAPVVINSRALVPVRFIAESLGADVQWDAKTNTVLIDQASGQQQTTPPAPKPDPKPAPQPTPTPAPAPTPSTFKLTTQVEGQGRININGKKDSYPAGTQVTLAAVPAKGWEFDHWEGAVDDSVAALTSVTMNANSTVQAVFRQQVQEDPTPGTDSGADAGSSTTDGTGSASDSGSGNTGAGTTLDPGSLLGTLDQNAFLSYINSFNAIGIPYLYGGTDLTPNGKGVDCSSYVQQMFAHFGITLPRTSEEQYTLGSQVARSALQAGDLIFFHTDGAGPTHVGIMTSSDVFISATVSGGVRTQSLSIDYWSQNYEGARRVLSWK